MMKTLRFSILFLMTMMALPLWASDEERLAAQLDAFLASSYTKAAHVLFWSDDLIYTSSSGLRFDKATILSGYDGIASTDDPPAVAYTAEDVDIRVHGDFAIVAFRLLGTPEDGSSLLNYFNTGTFRKLDGQWQAIAWQATVIPAQEQQK